jgi:hypothetical protein
MTVTVTLQDGDTEKFMRFGDAYIKHEDGTLDVVRDGAKQPHPPAPIRPEPELSACVSRRV